MKKFPKSLFLTGEIMSLVLALREFPHGYDILGMFLLLQFPILGIVSIMWLDRLTGGND